jgi:hypothetical protein
MSDDAIHWYRSKVDWWLALILCVAPIVSVAVCILLIMEGESSQVPFAAGSLALVAGLYFGLVIPMRYGLDDTFLHIRFGVFRKRIPLFSVLQVYPTRNPLSSPALSLDRLHVQFGEGMLDAVMISPANRELFLDEFAEKARMRRDGDRLLRV